MYVPGPCRARNALFNQRTELRGCFDTITVSAALDDPLRDSPRPFFLAVLPEHARYFRFSGGSQQVRGGPAGYAGRIHPHIEGLVTAEGEAASRVKLMRGSAKVEYRAMKPDVSTIQEGIDRRV